MKLQELEQKYEELGREIEKLKNQKKGKRWKPDCGEEYYFIGLLAVYANFRGIIVLRTIIYILKATASKQKKKPKNSLKTSRQKQS